MDANNGSTAGPVITNWKFTEDQLRRSPSVLAGCPFSDEQRLIRIGCTFIRRLADRLNEAQKELPKM